MLQAEQVAKLILENSRDRVSQKRHYFLPCGILHPVIFPDDIQKKGGKKYNFLVKKTDKCYHSQVIKSNLNVINHIGSICL